MAQQASGLQNIVSLVDLFRSKGGGTVTERNSVDPKAVQGIVNTILESNQGLSSIASGQKAAGLYNSTTNKLMLNDLVARTAAEGAKLNSSKTTTTAPKSQLNSGKTALGLAGIKLLTPTMKALSKKFELESVGDKIAGSIFGTGGGEVMSAPFAGFDGGGNESISGMNDLSSGFDVSSFAQNFGSDLASEAFGDSGLASELVDLGASSFADGASALFDSYSNVGADAVTNFLFADGGRVPSKKNFANGGSIIRRNPGLPPAQRPGWASENNSESNTIYDPGAVHPNERFLKLGAHGDYLGKNDSNVWQADLNALLARETMMSMFGGSPGEAASTSDGPYGSPGAFANAFGTTTINSMATGVVPSVYGVVNGIVSLATGKNILSNLYDLVSYAFGTNGGGAGPSDGSGGTMGGFGDVGGGFGDDGMGSVADSGDSGDGGATAANGGKIFRTGDKGSVAINNSSSQPFKGPLPGHDTKGKDDIQINVSGGEYVVPTDVVDILGEEFFDNILAALHKPIRGGK